MKTEFLAKSMREWERKDDKGEKWEKKLGGKYDIRRTRGGENQWTETKDIFSERGNIKRAKKE